MVDTVQPQRLLHSETVRVVATKKNLLLWNNTNPGHHNRRASSMVRGLDVAENIRAPGAGRKMFLDIPFYRTGDYTH